jgi:hypothetical protein
MATYSANPSVSGAVSATSSAASATLYTTPSNSYAIINLYLSAVGDFSVFIGGRLVHQSTGLKSYTVYAGPGQAVTFTNANPGVSVIEVSGVQFTNGV